ncbi:MAG: ABC transporter substrate-binding protein [Blautia sp.]
MKRTIVALLCAIFMTGSLISCGEEKQQMPVSSEAQSQENSQDSQEEEKEKQEDSEEEQSQSDEEKTETSSEGKTEGEEENMDEDLTMTALRDNGGTIDYTSLAELEPEPGTRIAVVAKTTKTGFWNTVKKGMDAAVKDLNEKMGYKGEDRIQISFEGPSDETDVESQINTIDAVLAENPAVLCVSAIDMASCQAQLENAEENGIPVIVLDSGVETGTVDALCATDNYAAGTEAARKLVQAIEEKGKVAVMTHVQSSQNSQDREKGFTDEIAKYPDIEIVNISHENEDSSIEEMTESVLTLFPDVKGYYCTNEIVGTSVLNAVKASGKQVAVVGFDAGKEQKEAIAAGEEVGVIAQNPYGMGYATVVAAVRAALNLPNDAYINPGYQWIDSETLKDKKYVNYLYE